MNNASIDLSNLQDESFDRSPWLRQREGELVKIIEAINKIAGTEEWSILENHIFGNLVETLDRRLNSEASKLEIKDAELYRLQGQITWAKKYADLKKLSDFYKLELTNVRKQLTQNV